MSQRIFTALARGISAVANQGVRSALAPATRALSAQALIPCSVAFQRCVFFSRDFATAAAPVKEKKSNTFVIKIGSQSLFTTDGQFMNLRLMCSLVETLSKLRSAGHKVMLVTSGAVSTGCQRMGIAKPKKTATKQAIAAVGQGRLMRLYDDLFSQFSQPVAQILLTRDCVGHKSRAMHILNTFSELFRLGVIPIINENDTVAVDEIKVGDNDTLAALAANLVRADYLVLLTDVDALYTANPHKNPNAKPIRKVTSLEDLKVSIEDGAGKWGTGGMETKITAAKIAGMAGCKTVICKAHDPEDIIKICVEGNASMGTLFDLAPKIKTVGSSTTLASMRNELVKEAVEAVMSTRQQIGASV